MNKLISKTKVFIVALTECNNDKEITTYLNKLVDRATPKKAIYNNNLCPQCNLLLNSDYKNNGHLLYCPRCGQRLKRSDKE